MGVHRYVLHNDRICEACEQVISAGQVGFLNGWGVFSTLRVSEGVLFAFERHFRRMEKDALRLHVPFPHSPDDLRNKLHRLMEANNARDATLRVAVVRNKGGIFEGPDIKRDGDLVAFTADLSNWGSGVNLMYVANARFGASPFAGTKYTSWSENLTWYEHAHQLGFDEALLLNERGSVSECTSANIFIASADELLTPPLDSSGCLPGVTRAILLEEVRVPGLVMREKEIFPPDVENARAVFITSTTRDLLPVWSVDGLRLRQDTRLLSRLSREFTSIRQRYVQAFRQEAVRPS